MMTISFIILKIKFKHKSHFMIPYLYKVTKKIINIWRL